MHFFNKSYRISLHSLHKYNYVIFDFLSKPFERSIQIT